MKQVLRIKLYSCIINMNIIYQVLHMLMLSSFLPTLLLVSGSLENSSMKSQTIVEQTPADTYVFAYIWEPESCYENPTWVQCADPQKFWETNFVIHGLWPQYSTGGYPSDCTDEPFDEEVIVDIGMDDMNQYWPNVKSNTSDPDYDSFWEHEWTKHGTCSPLSQENYFNTTLNLGKTFGTPSIITDNVGNMVSSDSIRSTFGGPTMVSLQCENGNYLAGAFTCWSMSSIDGSPNKQIACATDVQGEDNCFDNMVTIPSF